MADGWISVKERLPASCVELLGWVPFGENGIYLVTQYVEGNGWCLHNSVTHWRPLPAPPNREDDDE